MLCVTRKNYPIGGRTQSGVTLIEALIAGLVLSIGVLGIVTLITMSKVTQHEGIQRVRAVALADDILERIRRNPAGMSVYDIGLSAPLGNASIGSEPTPDCGLASCNATQLAGRDLWVWERLLDGASTTIVEDGNTNNTAGMRSVRACIDFTADTGKTNTGIVDVVLQWQGLQETFDAAAEGIVCGNTVGEDATRRQVIASSYVLDETEL